MNGQKETFVLALRILLGNLVELPGVGPPQRAMRIKTLLVRRLLQAQQAWQV